MASTLPPVKGSAFTFNISLVSQADTDIFKDNPTLAANSKWTGCTFTNGAWSCP